MTFPLWAVVLAIYELTTSVALVAAMFVLLREARSELRQAANRLSIVERARRTAVLGGWASLAESSRTATAALDPPGGRDMPRREGVVLMPDGSFPLPAAIDATAVLADFPSREEPQADPERAQVLPAPPLDPQERINASLPPLVPGTLPDPLAVIEAHGQPRQRMDPPPWETAAGAYDVFEGDDEPPREDPLTQAHTALAERAPAPEPAPEPTPVEPPRRDDPPPPSGGRALTPFGMDLAATLVGPPVRPRYRWNPVRLPAGHLPHVAPREWVAGQGNRALAYFQEPIRIWYRCRPSRQLVTQLWGELGEWVGSWPAGGRHRAESR